MLDPEELVKPLWNVARAEQLKKARAEAVHNAIQTVTAAEAARTAQVQEEGEEHTCLKFKLLMC